METLNDIELDTSKLDLPPDLKKTNYDQIDPSPDRMNLYDIKSESLGNNIQYSDSVMSEVEG